MYIVNSNSTMVVSETTTGINEAAAAAAMEAEEQYNINDGKTFITQSIWSTSSCDRVAAALTGGGYCLFCCCEDVMIDDDVLEVKKMKIRDPFCFKADPL